MVEQEVVFHQLSAQNNVPFQQEILFPAGQERGDRYWVEPQSVNPFLESIPMRIIPT